MSLLYSDVGGGNRTIGRKMARPGRPERPLNNEDGPLAALARGLRDLRQAAGSPSYRTLAKNAHYSRTVLADAASGERLPTLAVTLAYVRACEGDTDEWRARWHLCQQQVNGAALPAARPAPAASNGDQATANGVAARQAMRGRDARERGARAGRLLANPLVLALCGVVVLSQVEAVLIWRAAHTPATTRPSGPATTAIPVKDGTDPEASDCAGDAVNLDQSPVRLPGPATIAGQRFPAGSVLGIVALRYSRRCAGAWAKFTPANEVFGDNPGVAAVLLTVLRPADGEESIWRLPHVDEAYGDLLLTGLGCVTARASVELTGQRLAATGQTRCLPHN